MSKYFVLKKKPLRYLLQLEFLTAAYILTRFSLFVVFLILAKPRFSINTNQKSSNPMLIRLGENVTLMCPFENFDRFQWYKDEVPFDNKTINVAIHNISRNDQG